MRDGFDEYARRMPRDMSLDVIEIPAPKHHGERGRFKQEEGRKMAGKLRETDWVVALDENGSMVTSTELAAKIDRWRGQGRNVAFLIGGSDGLSESMLARADERLSLSALTLPHYVVRVILAEALYRAWSISAGHPYHRA